jgi:signal transduction histidine kinase
MVTLRAKLALAFALFAVVPLGAALWPVSRALSQALGAELSARLDAAARAVEDELARLGAGATERVVELARSDEAEALARDRASGALEPADEAARAAPWMAARGLDVLAVLEPDGRVVSSGHLPGRAGDVDPELAALVASAPPGRAVPTLVTLVGAEGVERVVALVAWAPLSGDPALRVAGGVALGPERAARLASLTGGGIVLRAGDGQPLAEAPPPPGPGPGAAPGRLSARVAARLAALGAPSRTLSLGPEDHPVATLELRVPPAGLARAELTVVLAFLAALGAGTLAAAAAGSLLASRITRPLEALRGAAARVAAGDLGARVEARASGEVGELVRAFDAMSAELAASRDRLAQAERVAAWREVARRLAHEIKNPLTPIAMSVETLRDAHARGRADFPALLEEGTQAIGEEVRRLKRIVDEFSRFARLPAPEPTPVAPAELVQAVLALFTAPPAGVVLVREVEPGLPPVLADRDQVLQVLLNLVRNALDAVPTGGTVRIAARRDAAMVRFDVADSGPGIPQGDLKRVFEPYFTTKQGGTGLGLAIAQRIAEEHGGRLDAASAAGEGATFTLRLPVA